jgi:glycosyltransferase involved in cell wall biosynthesis
MTRAEPISDSGGVLHVMWSMEIGGAERAVYQLVREQRRAGIRADVLLCRGGGLYAGCCRDVGAVVHELGQRRAADLRVAARARALLTDYEIAHFHGPELALIHLAARQPELRCYYTHRAGLFEYPAKQLIRYKLAGRYFGRSFVGISANTAQGAAAAARLFHLPIDSIAVTYNGIDFTLLEPRRSREAVLREIARPEDVVRVGTSAHLRNLKRVDRLLRALASRCAGGVEGLIVGDGPARVELEQLARRLGITERVKFVGRQDHIGDYLQLMDVFVLPSGPEESFGNSAVEAMGVGLPTIVFADGGGLLEHVEDGRSGFVVDSDEQLAERIGELARQPSLRRGIGDCARSRVRKRYSLDTMLRRYSDFYVGSLTSESVVA